MKSSTTPDFWAAYQVLPERVRDVARKSYQRWKENPSHPSLRWKQLVPGLWSIRVGLQYRALARVRGETAYWFGSVLTTNSTKSLRVLSLSDN